MHKINSLLFYLTNINRTDILVRFKSILMLCRFEICATFTIIWYKIPFDGQPNSNFWLWASPELNDVSMQELKTSITPEYTYTWINLLSFKKS